ncbi:DHH phosphoesterase [Pilatotrama ljubarskyi]|nr:DHH phosphoesterase [Pilatotrama ljubarskyi]
MASEGDISSNALSEFLRQTKQAYLDAVRAGKGRQWSVVMGNEAGDLDSIASAIAYAWYASKVKGASAVPLTQTPRSELQLRAENLYAFELAHLHPESDILCIDDIPESHPFPSVNFALVDHNRLQSRFSRDNPDARVVAVIDHHEDEGLYKDTADPRIVVVPTGSCASLVTQLFQSHPDQLTPELATLLLSSILIDTSGLKPGGKAEEADRRAASLLIPLASALRHQTERTTLAEQAPEEIPALQDLHATLQEKKASVAHLNTLDLLRRDYKEYALTPPKSPSREILVGLSSVPIGFKSWLPHHPEFWSQTEHFMSERGLTVLGILTSFRDTEKVGKSGRGKHRREQMYVVRDDEDLAKTLFAALDECEELELKRKTFPDYGVHKGFGPTLRAQIWKQKNVDATRKTTAPIVKGIIEGRNKTANL